MCSNATLGTSLRAGGNPSFLLLERIQVGKKSCLGRDFAMPVFVHRWRHYFIYSSVGRGSFLIPILRRTLYIVGIIWKKSENLNLDFLTGDFSSDVANCETESD